MAGPTATAERGGADEELGAGPPPDGRLPRTRTLILGALLLALAAVGCLWVLYGSQWLRAETVSVSGTRVLTPAQVREAADVPLGAPLISVDTDVIAARLRQKLPRIDEVDVDRSWPHGIDLKVTERKAVLIVEEPENGGKYVEVDATGVRFATVPRAPKGVPTLELAVPRQDGTRRFGEDRLVREAVRVAGDVPDTVARGTRTVKVRSYDSISLELADGRTVTWGSGEKGRAKARTLAALMKAAPRARHFDVSVPTAPASSGS
ncbi:cell division protein FtsQ/DivIB [Streptomyces sp. CRN 30]|uniref:cell division protein FtsQ/DivIB n=1 Tax=Streptomyces sp. CRN 30 TaxID=3075613 RepID=UPI002A81D8A8|nr:FtsQ-type POTRA domain-containing protein [Streptomyces sp. CRN 30]